MALTLGAESLVAALAAVVAVLLGAAPVAHAEPKACPYFGGRLTEPQVSFRGGLCVPTLPNCSHYYEESCCRPAEASAVMAQYTVVPDATEGCYESFNLLQCWPCSPDQVSWYSEGVVTVCLEICERIYDECAFYQGRFASGQALCEAQGFRVADADDGCFNAGPSTRPVLGGATGTLAVALVVIAAVAAATGLEQSSGAHASHTVDAVRRARHARSPMSPRSASALGLGAICVALAIMGGLPGAEAAGEQCPFFGGRESAKMVRLSDIELEQLGVSPVWTPADALPPSDIILQNCTHYAANACCTPQEELVIITSQQPIGNSDIGCTDVMNLFMCFPCDPNQARYYTDEGQMTICSDLCDRMYNSCDAFQDQYDSGTAMCEAKGYVVADGSGFQDGCFNAAVPRAAVSVATLVVAASAAAATAAALASQVHSDTQTVRSGRRTHGASSRGRTPTTPLAAVALVAMVAAAATLIPTPAKAAVTAGDTVTMASSVLGEIDSLRDSLKIDELQSLFEGAGRESTLHDTQQDVIDMEARIADVFASKIAAVDRVAEEVVDLYTNWDGSTADIADNTYYGGPTSSSQRLPPDLAYDEQYGTEVSFEHSIVKVPLEVEAGIGPVQSGRLSADAAIAWTSGLEDTFKELYEADSSLKWVYFATTAGVHRKYPGNKWPRDSIGFPRDFDPRTRPWFVSATQGPRDVVIVIDSTQSMLAQRCGDDSCWFLWDKWDMQMRGVRTIINSLTGDDYVSLVVLRDGGAETQECLRELTRATPTVKRELLRTVATLRPRGYTSFSAGLNLAYAIFRNSEEHGQTSNCARYLLMFTDSYRSELGEWEPCGGGGLFDTPDCPPDDYRTVVDANADLDVRSWVFSFGPGIESASANALPTKLGCASCADGTGQCGQGQYWRFEFDSIDLLAHPMSRTNFQGYFDFFVESAASEETIVTAPYVDSGGKLGLMLTVAKPVRHSTAGLLGVAGADLGLRDVETLLQTKTWGSAYWFLITERGETVVHPRLQKVDGDTGAGASSPDFVDISLFETTLDANGLQIPAEFAELRAAMVAGGSGETTIATKRVLPAGDAALEGLRTVEVTLRYTYRRITGTTLTICLVTDPETDINYSELSGVLADGESVVESFYHRLDLYGASDNSAWRSDLDVGVDPPAYPHTLVAPTKSGVKVAPKGFCDSVGYVDKVAESEADLVAVHAALNAYNESHPLGAHECDGDLDPFADSDVANGDGTRLLKREVVNAARVTSAIEPVWAADGGSVGGPDVVWRYVSTSSGMHRNFPAHPYHRHYDPSLRSWFNRALAFKGQDVVSTPYLDASGAGSVITLSRTIDVGLSGEETTQAVAGIDMTYESFHSLVVGALPGDCNADGSGVRCFLMDTNGLLVFHPDFIADSGVCSGHTSQADCDVHAHCQWHQDPFDLWNPMSGECNDSLEAVHVGHKEGQLAMDLLYETKSFIEHNWIDYLGTCKFGFARNQEFADHIENGWVSHVTGRRRRRARGEAGDDSDAEKHEAELRWKTHMAKVNADIDASARAREEPSSILSVSTIAAAAMRRMDKLAGSTPGRDHGDGSDGEGAARRLQDGAGAHVGQATPVDPLPPPDWVFPAFNSRAACMLSHRAYTFNPGKDADGVVTGSYAGACGSGTYFVTPLGDTNLQLLVIDDYVGGGPGFECAWVNAMVANSAVAVPPGCSSIDESGTASGDNVVQKTCAVTYKDVSIPCEISGGSRAAGTSFVTMLCAVTAALLLAAEAASSARNAKVE